MDFVISDNPAQMVWQGFNDICILVSKNLVIVMRVKGKGVPMFYMINQRKYYQYVYQRCYTVQCSPKITMAQLYLFGSEATINIMNDLFAQLLPL